MTKTLTRICFAALFLGLPFITGCGRSGENEVVSGATPDFVDQIQKNKQGYGESMKAAADKGPGG